VSRTVLFPGKRPLLRQCALPRPILGVSLVAGVLALTSTPGLAGNSWDCRAAADGTWLCEQGEPLKAVPAAAAETRMPAEAPASEAPDRINSAAAAAAAPAVTKAAVEAEPAAAHPAPDAQQTGPTSEPAPAQSSQSNDSVHAETTATAASTTAAITAPLAAEVQAESSPDAAPGPAAGLEELPRVNLDRLDEGVRWEQCASVAITPSARDEDQLPIEIEADSAEASDLDQRADFFGSVAIRQGSQQIFAREVHYDHSDGEIRAVGDALLLRPDLRLAADELQYNLRSGKGEAHDAEYRLTGILARGTAARAQLIDAANTHYTQINYTTCPPGDSAWKLDADQLEVDTAEGMATATGARMFFADIPVMYLPKLTFPIDDRRRSGVLAPSFGYGDRHGADLSVPYYFNLAPNYDLTLTPRLMSKRGLMLDGEFRFLTSAHQGEINASFIPDDKLAPAGSDMRGGLSLNTHSSFSERISSSLKINRVSDDDFLEDFGPDIETYATSHLESAAAVRYSAPIWSASAEVQTFQTIDPLITAAGQPYEILPRLRFQAADRLDLATPKPANYTFSAEFANFSKDDSVVEGRRLDLNPRVAMPLRKSWYHLIPAVGLRYTRYQLDNQTPGLDASPDRLLPTLSLDSGLYFDRDMQWFGRGATQSLEPRIFYLYVPEEDQDDLPIFDTGRYGLNFDSLFRENRFSSADRVGDANQLTLALSSTISDLQTGEQLLRAGVGQILYLKDRRVQLPGVATETDRTSPLIADLSAALNRHWRTRGELVWNPHSKQVEQALARASYRADSDHIFSASYRLRDVLTSETDLAAIWPIGANTRAIARWNYSLTEQRNLDALAGIEYGQCCWKIRTLLRQQVTGTGGDQNLSFLVQLELRGLAKLGDNIDSVLRDGIYGYRNDD